MLLLMNRNSVRPSTTTTTARLLLLRLYLIFPISPPSADHGCDEGSGDTPSQHGDEAQEQEAAQVWKPTTFPSMLCELLRSVVMFNLINCTRGGWTITSGLVRF